MKHFTTTSFVMSARVFYFLPKCVVIIVFMKFPDKLIQGRLIRRYKRFLADVRLENGAVVTAHTANTGAMAGCSEPGSRVWLSVSDNLQRKYAHTWELVEAGNDNILVGINTLLANKLAAEAIESGVVKELSGYDSTRTEVRYGDENSRIDLLLSRRLAPPCYVEVKNVTLVKDNIGYFPDAQSVRAVKHLRELTKVAMQGASAVIFFCVPREDVIEVRAADFIDPVYADGLKTAVGKGVQALAYGAKVNLNEIVLNRRLPVVVK